MKKLAILDFDGTLFDSVHDVMIILNRSLEMNGFPTLTHDEYIKRLGGNIDEIVSLVLNDQSTPENIEIIKKTYEELYEDSDNENTIPFPRVHDVLRQLQDKGIILAINSNRKTDSIRFYTDKFFEDIDFVAIEGHSPYCPSKPDPCGVKRIMDVANASNDETIYIGDSITDINTAKNADIDCLIVEWGYGTEEAFEDDYVLDFIGDACEIINYF